MQEIIFKEHLQMK